MSLHPKGTTYASCGGSGNVIVHSTDPATFGRHRTTLTTGRGRFGLCCAYVRSTCLFIVAEGPDTGFSLKTEPRRRQNSVGTGKWPDFHFRSSSTREDRGVYVPCHVNPDTFLVPGLIGKIRGSILTVFLILTSPHSASTIGI